MGELENTAGPTFADDTQASQYTLRLDGDVVSTLDYRDDGRTVALTATNTPPAFRGKGYAAELVDRAVAGIEARGDRTVEAECPFVVAWFERHPERADILDLRDAG